MQTAQTTQPDIAVEELTLHVNGLDFHVLTAGKGEPVLLLHGFPDSAKLWRHVIPALVRGGYRVIAPDQRGYGLTDAPVGKDNYQVERLGADALGILDALGIRQAHLVGHDWGGIVGWWLAANHGDRSKSYVTLAQGHPATWRTSGFGQKLKSWYVPLFNVPGLGEAIFSGADWLVLRKFLRHRELKHWLADLARPGRLTAALNWYRANVSRMPGRHFPDVDLPVLGVWASGDVALTEAQMTLSVRYVRGSFRYERLDGSGHWMTLDAPDAVNRLLLDFLSPS